MNKRTSNVIGIKREGACGTLYVVSTPIGNMEDITLRALKTLNGVSVIAAESVVHTKGLCEHYDIKTKRISYNQHNRKIRTLELVRRLKSGQDVALVTNAGTPGISDPGTYLIRRAACEHITVSPVPGPSAVVAALSVSGMPSEHFVFAGFLPNKPGKRKKALAGLVSEARTMVFFEAPHRIRAMLCDLMEILGDRQIVMLREITKAFEDMERGPVSSVLDRLSSDRIRGEFTLVVEGKKEEKSQPLNEGILNRMEYLLTEESRSIRDIAELLSKEEGIAYRQIYKECLSRKQGFEKIEVDGTI